MEGRRNSAASTSSRVGISLPHHLLNSTSTDFELFFEQAGGDNDDFPSSSSSSPSANGKNPPPRTLWQGRDEKSAKDNPQSVARRSSLEKLKRASRVQNNSKLFNKPDAKAVRPSSYHGAQPSLALGPPLTFRTAPARGSFGSTTDRSSIGSTVTDRSSIGSITDRSRIPLPTPKSAEPVNRTPTRASPTKSSLLSSYKSNLYDSEDAADTRTPARRPKSVTWDKDEPHVLEYELVTPDPSVVGSPSGEYDSDEYDDEDDLENTPVIEPDGWRMPESIIPHEDDEYRSTPSPNGRPLPPIPARCDSASPSGARPLPTLPLTKAELQNQATMSIEERMRRMMEGNDPTRRLSWDPNNRRRSRQGPEFQEGLGIALNKPSMEYCLDDEHMKRTIFPEDMTSDRDESSPNSNREPDGESIVSSQYESASDYEPPRISRESIRRQVEERRNQQAQDSETDSEQHEMTRGAYYSSDSGLEDGMYVRHGSSDDGVDMYARPDMQKVPQRPASRFATRAPDPDQVTESEASVYDDQDEESHYSEMAEDEQHTPRLESSPIPGSPASTATAHPDDDLRKDLEEMRLDDGAKVSLPDFSSLADGDLGLTQYMTPATPAAQEGAEIDAPSTSSAREFLARDGTAHVDEISDEESDTGSVIRHKIEYSDEEDDGEYEDGSDFEDHGDQEEQGQASRSPSPVAESVATIRAPGGQLKTRASATPADIAAMAAARRHVSGDQSNPPPPMPRMPNGYRSEGESATGESSDGEDTEETVAGLSDTEGVNRRVSGTRRRKVSATLPALGEFEFDLKLDDLNDEFDRVIEKQKRGYLMRQNTKVIHASNRDPDDDKNSTPDRPGHVRGQSWSVEPWRSSHRRRSHRDSSLRKRLSNGAVPPLPGKEGVSSRLPSVSEAGRSSSMGSADGDNVERGRLFVKVVGVKDLALPVPPGQPTYFCLTLDNGLHCVTTSWLELGKNAPIGQEFELVVLNDLEFQLTLQAKLEQPPQPPPKTATKPPVVKQPKVKQSTFSKVFSTPRRRKQLELQQQQAAEQQQLQLQRQMTQEAAPVTAWDLLHGLVARDGSFARSYVCLKDFESRAYGRPLTTEIHCFNEWAVDTASIKGKKGMQGGLQPARKAPYKIGKLEVQLFFVPKPKGASDKDLPKSMNAAIRELREAESLMDREWEGNLSQQGGDCPFWRRRYFKLKGVRLTAYHEATRQPRATINLSKAVKLIDDRRTLVENTVAGPGKTRRKSGFSEDEEGYMFVEEGFRIRFANGEVIDFYADSAEEKRAWLKILGDTIGHVPDSRGWCQMVLAREAKARTEKEKMDAVAEKLRTAQQQMKQQPPRVHIQPPPPRNSGLPGSTYRPIPAPNPTRRPQSQVYR
ncbi:cell division protein anillin-domain-containing protein [Sphaerosporella brunnea]|uniref:Cell division protein anillin-domain-containing protein n=1 Tax=Sphaerosporella brunnea TaxID=1250544 RepID=A0A5J5EDC7_9PEZI|nr:cell division protein anillin-domain-containing protein [Sphaerosporella brunnea]